MKQWKSALDTLQDIPNDEIISKLKISYDGLGDAEKQVFLDLACFFLTLSADNVKKLFTELKIDILVEKSLLFVSTFGWIGMHDLIREMGQRIAVQEYPKRRIFLQEDVVDILTENKGEEAVEGILIPLKSNTAEDTIHLSSEVFKNMKRLRIIMYPNGEKSMHFCSHDPINFLPNSLCWFDWSYYPSASLPENFEPPKLVGLILRCSYVVDLWKRSKHLSRLTIVDLSYSRNIIKVPDLSGSPNLETLILDHCIQLVEVHSSVGVLKKLIHFLVEDCEKLEKLPTKFHSGSLEILNFAGCQNLRKIPEIQQNVMRISEFMQLDSEHCNALSFLDLSDCIHIETLPSSICRLKTLKYLYLNRCSKLKSLPEDIGDLVNLEGLDASETSIWGTPDSITLLGKLKWLSFRKVPKYFRVTSLCSWGCFIQCDMNFQLPSDFSVMCLLRTLDLSACNLFDGSIPEDLGCLTSLSELNLSRNYFTYLPRSIAQLNCLRHLDITYCEKLIELPELPPCIMKLFTDDRFALQSIQTLPALYKELQLVSFANRKLQELWCASHRKDSGVEMRNCLRENMTDMLEEILLPFLSMVQLKVFSDGLRRRGGFGFVFPGSDPSGEVPMWFKHHETLSEMISINLNSQWYNDKFMGIAIYCQLPFLNDAPPNYRTMKSLANFCWGAAIRCKLVSGCGAMDPPTLEKIVHLEVSNVVAYDSHDCFVFLQLDMTKVYSKGKGKDPLFDPNDYCRFEASLNRRISTNWGIRLVYADDIEETRLKWARQFRKEWPGIQKEELALWKERVDRLSIPKDFQFFVNSLVLCTLPVLPTCPRCLSFAEDFNHVFVNCKYSQLVWRGSRLGLNFEVGTPVQFVGWLFCTWFLEAPEDEDATLSLAILWAIWNHRNKVVHERAVFVPSEVISTAIEEHLRFPNSKSREKEALKEGARETAVGLKAHCVHVDIEQDDKVLVMEVKGAWKEGQEWAGVAWIAYNKQGVKVAAARKSLKVISTLHADVHAFEYAMTSVVGRVSEVIILSDNDTLIKQLQVWDCCSDRDIVYMLHECVEYLKEMKISWKVVKVPRYAVSAAKRSAKMAMTTYMDVLNSALQ